MANKIQIKRGLQASLPTLDVGEPALTTNSGAEKVYIGTGTGNKEIPTLVGGVLPVSKGGTGSSTLNNGTVGLGSVLNYGIATQAEAQVGTSNVKYMTPLRVNEAINQISPLPTISKFTTSSTAVGNGTNTVTVPLGKSPLKYVRIYLSGGMFKYLFCDLININVDGSFYNTNTTITPSTAFRLGSGHEVTRVSISGTNMIFTTKNTGSNSYTITPTFIMEVL